MKKIIFMLLTVSITFALSVCANAESTVTQASISDFTIELDGEILPTPFPILNHDDRAYTPARVIAEALGAYVEFEEETKKIIIKSPSPEVKEIIKEVIVEVPVYEKAYSELPVSQAKNRVTMDVTDIVRTSGATYVYASVLNKNQFYILLKYRDFYIEADGEIYRSADNFKWANSISGSEGSLEGQIVFESIPKDTEKIRLVIPFTTQNSTEENEFRFDILLK